MNEDIFEVGLPVSIETEYKYYLTTHIIGWERDLFVLTGIAHLTGKSGHLKVNEPCKIRFLKEGVAYGFQTGILAVNANPFPVLFFRYPQTIEQFKIRKFDRIKSNFPAQLLDSAGTRIADATVTDISEGGCGMKISVARRTELACEKEYTLAFRILETDMCIGCAIRKMRVSADTRCLGIEFCHITEEEREKIKIFIEVCSNVFTSRLDAILTKMKASEEILGGNIEELPVSDILQIFDHLKKEGIIYIASGTHTGSIKISNGRIMDAFWGHLQGEDALVELLSLKDGMFHFKIQAVKSGLFIRSINSALMDASRLIDEREAMKAYFPAETDALILVKDQDMNDPEIQTIINAFRDGVTSVAGLNTATGLSLIRAGLITARLIKDGFVLTTS